MGSQRRIDLETTTPRKGLSRERAAVFIGVGVTKFDEMVRDGRMPKPKRIDGRLVWDIRRLDMAFEALPDEGDANPWDKTCGFASGTGPAK